MADIKKEQERDERVDAGDDEKAPARRICGGRQQYQRRLFTQSERVAKSWSRSDQKAVQGSETDRSQGYFGWLVACENGCC